jgi:hypothetical protein
MESMDLFILNNDCVDDRIVILTENMYTNILDSINFNYLLIIFTIGCFSSLLCCNKDDKRYSVVGTTEVIEGKIVQ